jgi:hypothetical protein
VFGQFHASGLVSIQTRVSLRIDFAIRVGLDIAPEAEICVADEPQLRTEATDEGGAIKYLMTRKVRLH